MIVYTDSSLVSTIPPKRCSVVFGWDFEGEPHYVAEYDPESLPEDESWYIEHHCWWRKVGQANCDVPYNLSGILEAGGILQYLCDGDPQRYTWSEDGMTKILDENSWVGGVSADRNVAACIGEMALDAGMDAIEMVNKVTAAMRILEGDPT